MLLINYHTRLAMWLVAHEKKQQNGSCSDFATKVGIYTSVKRYIYI